MKKETKLSIQKGGYEKGHSTAERYRRQLSFHSKKVAAVFCS